MRAIFFDLDDTLLHFTREYRDVLADAVRDVEGEVEAEWIDEYDEVFFDRFDECDPNPIRATFERIDCPVDPDALEAALRERELEAYERPEGVHETLDRLGERYALGVLSNGTRDWQERKLEAFDLRAHFDAVVATYEVGVHKPATAPYRAAERRLPADDYAMVGDEDSDLEGARAVGWTAHKYEGDGFEDLPDAIEW